ncbi:MAG: gamma-glutamyltransferase [Burkholderiales bacterium]|nr:gamma-glutamyltransferase [Burkholderiales bacterium]
MSAKRAGRRPALFVCGAAVSLAGALAAGIAAAQPAPEGATGYAPKPALVAKRFAIVAANPLAADAGYAMLERGGSAVDAAIAAQLVLNVVEPQSSGIGGGGFLLHYDARARRLAAYDGRETAPAAATPRLFLDAGGTPMPFGAAVGSGRSVGVPGLVAMLELAHRRHGVLPWHELFAPAIRLAEAGFAISPRLAALAARDPLLRASPTASAFFHAADGTPKPAGTWLANPELAATLRAIAQGGARAFYAGPIAADIARAVQTDPRGPGTLTEADLAAYRPVVREALCRDVRAWRVCGMPPPSAGGIATIQILALLGHTGAAALPADSPLAVHLFAQAARLAFADRDRWVADPAFAEVPVRGLTDARYLERRAQLIRPARPVIPAPAGEPPGAPRDARAAGDAQEAPATTHVSVIDARGDAVALTTSIESAFGNRAMVRGFFLNNQLTDFSFAPEVDGVPVANRVAPGKRPRSAMSPTIVFDRAGRVALVVGSPGGPWIINYVARTLVATLDRGQSVQAAIDAPNYGSRNGPLELEAGTAVADLAPSLERLGDTVRVIAMPSGLAGIQRVPGGWLAAADPRREGAARGE